MGAMPRTAPDPVRPFQLDFAPLRQRRRLLEITSEDLARAVGVHYTTIYRLEHNKHRAPSVPLLVAVARALGVPMHQLFSVREGPRE
jgi:DNA-binding XRE family transcriptional regulator